MTCSSVSPVIRKIQRPHMHAELSTLSRPIRMHHPVCSFVVQLARARFGGIFAQHCYTLSD